MAIKKTYWLVCNHCGDPYWDNSDNVAILRRKAKSEGWHHSKFAGDVCPKCLKLEDEEYKGLVKNGF